MVAVSRVTKTSLSREVLSSNPTGAVSNIGQVCYPTLPKSRDASSLSEKDGSRSQTKGGRRHSKVKAFPRWLLVSFL